MDGTEDELVSEIMPECVVVSICLAYARKERHGRMTNPRTFIARPIATRAFSIACYTRINSA